VENKPHKDEGILEFTMQKVDHNVQPSFNKKIKQSGDGLDLSGKAKMNVDFFGVQKDIVHDHIWSPSFEKKSDYDKIRADRLKRKQQRERELFGYSITDDRFNTYEKEFSGQILADKAKDYKRLGVSYRGANGTRVAFSQKDKAVRQDCDVFERGQDPFKRIYKISTIEGHHNVPKDYQEEKHDDILHAFAKRRHKSAPKVRKSVDFKKILEQDIRNRKELLHANQRESVDGAVKTALKNYNKKMATGGIKEARGRFQAGHRRRRFLDMAQKANREGGDYEFTLDTKNAVNVEAYHFNNGTDRGKEQIDRIVKNEPVDDGKPESSSINIEAVPTQI